jgi:hypothetical protein
MTTKTRYVVIYKSNDPTNEETISFGVKTKTKAQALTRTREFIYANELHENSTLFDYKLTAEPSMKPALHEIPDEEGQVEYPNTEDIVYEDF